MMSESKSKSVAVSPQRSSISVRDHILNVRRHSLNELPPRFLQPVENGGVRLLMLENISQEAVFAFRALGFHVDHYTSAMAEEELVQKISSYHAIGIRSKTKITSRIIQAAPKVHLFYSPLDVFLMLPFLSWYSYWSSDVSALAQIKST
jgi:D-3-phosphoglycerate dehydrogenase / 2-oxoglutarate reductase